MLFFLTDLRYARRKIRQRLGVSLSIIVLLALGMGGIITVFNPIYSTIFASLPFPQPERLVRIGGDIPLFNIRTSSFEKEEILHRIFSDITVYHLYPVRIRIPDTGKQIEVQALRVTENFFETLGVKPLIGHDFTFSENTFGFVVSHRFWRNELMGKSDAIGGHVLLSDGYPMPIIGIMPENFNFPINTDLWMGKRSGTTWGSLNDVTHFIGRVRPGISLKRAAEELKSIDTRALEIDVFSGNVTSCEGPIIQSLQTFLYSDQRPMLRMLGTTAILFLALICAGVVNLLIAQGVKQKREIATKLILGATRWNMVSQLLKETLPLVVIGGLAGWWLSENINTWMWTQMPALKGGTVDTPIKITFLMVLVLGVTLIGGLVPSLYVTNLDLNSYLKSAPRNRRLFSTQEFLVGVQLSLTLMLLVGVGMLVRSMLFNVDIPIGWATRDVAVVTLEHPRYSNVVMSGNEARRYAKLNQDIQQELYAMSEVMSVGILSPIPFSAESARSSQSQLVISKTLLPQGQSSLSGSFGAMALSASPNGFSILGIPLVSGRYFTEADVANRNEIVGRSLAERLKYGRDEGAVIINQALAERMWPGENPIDKIFYVMDASYKVVGVIQNYHHVFGNKDFIPTRYIPATDALIKLEFLVKLRPNTSLKNFHLNVRKRLSDFVLDWLEIQPLGERVEDAMANKRLTLQLLSCFAILGIIVSGLAVYSIATLAAVSRIKEMGVRMALGAQTRNIYRLAFCRGIRAILLGLPLGLLLALILCKVLSSFLVYANIYDPLIWTMSCGMLIVITIVAAIIPILRVTHVDPVNVLRNE